VVGQAARGRGGVVTYTTLVRRSGTTRMAVAGQSKGPTVACHSGGVAWALRCWCGRDRWGSDRRFCLSALAKLTSDGRHAQHLLSTTTRESSTDFIPAGKRMTTYVWTCTLIENEKGWRRFELGPYLRAEVLVSCGVSGCGTPAQSLMAAHTCPQPQSDPTFVIT